MAGMLTEALEALLDPRQLRRTEGQGQEERRAILAELERLEGEA